MCIEASKTFLWDEVPVAERACFVHYYMSDLHIHVSIDIRFLTDNEQQLLQRWPLMNIPRKRKNMIGRKNERTPAQVNSFLYMYSSGLAPSRPWCTQVSKSEWGVERFVSGCFRCSRIMRTLSPWCLKTASCLPLKNNVVGGVDLSFLVVADAWCIRFKVGRGTYSNVYSSNI